MIELGLFKILSEKYDKEVADFVKLNHGESVTRGHSLKMFKERSRPDIRKYSFLQRSVDIWNSLPESVVVSAISKSVREKTGQTLEHPGSSV